MSERSEFASPPSLRHKFKEGVAISGAHFFAYFLWARPKKVSQPRQGMKQGMNHQQKTIRKKNYPCLRAANPTPLTNKTAAATSSP